MFFGAFVIVQDIGQVGMGLWAFPLHCGQIGLVSTRRHETRRKRSENESTAEWDAFGAQSGRGRLRLYRALKLHQII